MGMIIPPVYPLKRTLKSLCYDYNGFEELSYEKIATTSILGMDLPSDTIYQAMLFTVCTEYWYDEIGFDIDEIFIERFVNTWSRYASIYHDFIQTYLDNNFNARTRNITSKETNTGATNSTKSGTDTTNNTGTVTNVGAVQDYQVQTRDSSVTQTNDLSSATTYDTTVVNEQDLEKNRTINEEYTVYEVEKLREMLKSVDIFEDFVLKFNNLFMQIMRW